MKKELDPVDHLAWALAGINIYWQKFRETGDICHGQQALEYARRLDKQWQGLLGDLERSVDTGETAAAPVAVVPSREKTTLAGNESSAPLVSA